MTVSLSHTAEYSIFALPVYAGKFAVAVQAGNSLFIFVNVDFLAVEAEFSACDSVGVSAYGFALIVAEIDVTVKAVKADCDVVHSAVFIRSVKGLKRCAVGDYLKRYAVFI